MNRVVNMIRYKTKILSSGQLKRLSEHKYSCTSISLLDPILQPWWRWLVSRVPLWLAPNLITIVGLIINILTTLILIGYLRLVGPNNFAIYNLISILDSVQMLVILRHVGLVFYVPQDYLYIKVQTLSMVNRQGEQTHQVLWVNYLIMDVIQYRQFLQPCPLAYRVVQVFIQIGYFSR